MIVQLSQIINSLLLLGTLPFSLSLLYQLIVQARNKRSDIVRYILILIFSSISLAALFSLHLSYLLIVKNISANDVLLEATIRNMIKNFSFLITSLGFWYIERRRGE